MKLTSCATLSCALAICTTLVGAAAAAEGNAPLTVGDLCLRQPQQNLVQFSGALIYGVTGGGPAPILYAGGPIGLIAGVLTQGAIEKHQQSKEKQRWQESADRVLEPYRAVLDDFTNAQLMRQALKSLPGEGKRTLLKFTDPAGEGLQIESAPAYYMTHDARVIILENTLLVRNRGGSKVNAAVQERR